MKGIFWLKRDFRLHDNPALTQALNECDEVLILYIVEPNHIKANDTSTYHLHAIGQAFDCLRLALRNAGRFPTFAEGEVVHIFDQLYKLRPFDRLYSHQETGVDYTYQRDIAVANWCKSRQVIWQEPIQTGVFRKLVNRDIRNKLWASHYRASALPTPSNALLQKISSPSEYRKILSDTSLYDTFKRYGVQENDNLQRVTETTGLHTLDEFLYSRGVNYRGGISSPNTAFESCSRLSTHLAWGTLSPRFVYQRTLNRLQDLKESKPTNSTKWQKSLNGFMSRLHWRDHFIQRLEREPQMEFQAINPAFRDIKYSNDPVRMQAFVEGQTGFPLVDAVVRCLRSTGYVNFRMRAMITSFACHGLHLDWRAIHFPLAKWFLDYEPGIHISQLQMQASVVGINTVRVYSPTKQLIDQDPQCIFVKKWIPELRGVNNAHIIKHSTYDLGNYPGMIINHKIESQKMKDQIWQIKRKNQTPALSQQVYLKHGSRKRPNRTKQIRKPKEPKPSIQLKLDFGS